MMCLKKYYIAGRLFMSQNPEIKQTPALIVLIQLKILIYSQGLDITLT